MASLSLSQGVLLLMGSLGFYLWVNLFGPEAQAAGHRSCPKGKTIWCCAGPSTPQLLTSVPNPPPSTDLHNGGPLRGLHPVGAVAFGLGDTSLLLLPSGGLLQQGELLRRGNDPLREAELARRQLQGQLPNPPTRYRCGERDPTAAAL